ncbi:MAG TPA: hypothetical protein VHQ65_16965 [Thermoanaerobaculia bacterium]|nr:hypothetical protein [Thermoanaerobaculia bacterium]
MDDTPQPPPSVGASGPSPGGSTADPLTGIARISLLAGLAPLIPLPFVDDWAEAMVRRRAVADLLRERGLDPTPGDVAILAGLEGDRRTGCVQRVVVWTVMKLPLYLLKKIFRKVIYVLAIHDGVNAASSLFHDAYLLRHALAGGVLDAAPGGRVDREAARRVRRAVEATVAETDTQPLRRVIRTSFAGSNQTLAAGAEVLGRAARGTRAGAGDDGEAQARAAEALPLEEEERLLAPLIDRLAAAFFAQAGYRQALERRLEAHLETHLAGETPPPPPPAAGFQ